MLPSANKLIFALLYSPLEEYSEAAVGREESPLDEVELVEVLEEQRDAVRVPRRRPHRLPDVHELCKVASRISCVCASKILHTLHQSSLTRDCILVVVPVLGVVLEDKVLEGLAEVDLLRLLQAQRDHRDARSVTTTN